MYDYLGRNKSGNQFLRDQSQTESLIPWMAEMMTQQKTFTMVCHKCGDGLEKPHIILYEETGLVPEKDIGEINRFVRCPECSSFKYVQIEFDPYETYIFPASFRVYCEGTCVSDEYRWTSCSADEHLQVPSMPEFPESSNSIAADEVLKKFFKRREQS